MTYEDVARQLVDHLNSRKEKDNFNRDVTYELEHWLSDFSPTCHQAVICHVCCSKHDGCSKGPLCWTSICDKCVNFDEACEHMLKRYFNGKISFSSPEELSLKMTIRGMM